MRVELVTMPEWVPVRYKIARKISLMVATFLAGILLRTPARFSGFNRPAVPCIYVKVGAMLSGGRHGSYSLLAVVFNHRFQGPVVAYNLYHQNVLVIPGLIHPY